MTIGVPLISPVAWSNTIPFGKSGVIVQVRIVPPPITGVSADIGESLVSTNEFTL